MNKEPQRHPPKQGKLVPRSTWDRISKPITVVCIVVTALLGLFVYYHTQQKEIWEGRLNQKKEELETKKQEVDKVKEDLKARAERESKQPLNAPAAGQPRGTNQVTVMKSQTMSVADDLNITLTDVVFEPNPPRYKVNAKVSYAGAPEMQIHDAKEGSIITYPKDHGYDIELLKADSVSAKFSIKKNP